MKYKLFKTNQFKRTYKKLKLSDSQEEAFIDVVYKLLNAFELEKKYRDHPLTVNYSNYRECHLKTDILLIYQYSQSLLKLVDIGSHSSLFG